MQKILEKLTNPLIFIVAAAFLRILPHAPNFAPIGAMALFSGSYLDKRTAFIVPLSAMVLSDLFIGFDSIISRLTVYGAFISVTLIGFWLRSHKNPTNIILCSVLASVTFFVITNFGVWLTGTLYPRTLSGLVDCFILAIPFFRNTLAGDLVYTGLFFGGFELIRYYSQEKKLAKLKVEV